MQNSLSTTLFLYLLSMMLMQCSPETSEDEGSSSESGFSSGQTSTAVTGANLASASGECKHTNKSDTNIYVTAECRLVIRNSAASFSLLPDGYQYATSITGATWSIDLGDQQDSFACSHLEQSRRLFCFSATAVNFSDTFEISLTLTSETTGEVFHRTIISTETTAASSPLPPTAASAVAAAYNSVNLSWVDSSTTETSYVITRGGDGVTYFPLATIAADLTSYNDSTVAASSPYYYKVKACNASGCSTETETGLVNTPSSEQRIFVSSSSYLGNLGGLSGADSLCQGLADGQALGGTWKAILSAVGVNAKDRITVSGVVNNLAAAKVADDAADMWSGDIDSAVVRSESGTVVSNYVFTGSNPGGMGGVAVATCNSWTDSTNSYSADVGSPSGTTTWLSTSGIDCDQTGHLYCIDGQ